MKKNIIFLLSAIFVSLSGIAQELRSSYFTQTSVFKHQLNPALLDKSYVGFPLLGNINISTSGRNGLSTFIYPLSGNSQYKLTTFMSPTVSPSEFLNKIDSKVGLNVFLNHNLASVSFKAFGGRNLIEMNLRSKTSLSLPYDLFAFLKQTGGKSVYSFDKLGLKTENYVEFVLGHSREITENLTIGAKVKVLAGLGYAGLKINKLDLTLTEDVWSIEGDAEGFIGFGNTAFEHETNPNPRHYDASRGKKVKGIKTPNGFDGISGLGAAIDFGLNYKVDFIEGLSLSAAVTDLGFINWKNLATATSKGTWKYEGFDNISVYDNTTGTNLDNEFKAMGDELNKIFSPYDNGTKTSRNEMLAGTINLGAEYQMPFYDKLRLGLLVSHYFNGIHQAYSNMFSVNVRPLKWFEASINTAYTSEGWTSGGMISFYTKGFNLYVGSDRLPVGKLSKQFIPLNNLNSNINFGINIPLEKK